MLLLTALIDFRWSDIDQGLFTQKKSRTLPKKFEKSEKKSKISNDFFEDLKSVFLIWE